jgi:hypothetical protein
MQGLFGPDGAAVGSGHVSGLKFDFGRLGLDQAAWQRAYDMPWRRRVGSFRLFNLVRDMEKP